MTSPLASNPLGLANPLFKLEYPQSIGVYTSYGDAQKAVDSLADQNFPVGNLAIVGTDLKLIERVTGRKTWGTVLTQGVSSGLSTALMVALIMWFINPERSVVSIFATALLVGIGIGVAFAAIGHLASKGQRDFTSVSQTIPSKFEILCEHKVAADARALLSKGPDARAAAFDPSRFPAQPAQPYGAPYGAPGQQPQYPAGPYAGQPYAGQPYAGQPYGGSPFGQPQVPGYGTPQAPAQPAGAPVVPPPAQGQSPYAYPPQQAPQPQSPQQPVADAPTLAAPTAGPNFDAPPQGPQH